MHLLSRKYGPAHFSCPLFVVGWWRATLPYGPSTMSELSLTTRGFGIDRRTVLSDPFSLGPFPSVSAYTRYRESWFPTGLYSKRTPSLTASCTRHVSDEPTPERKQPVQTARIGEGDRAPPYTLASRQALALIRRTAENAHHRHSRPFLRDSVSWCQRPPLHQNSPPRERSRPLTFSPYGAPVVGMCTGLYTVLFADWCAFSLLPPIYIPAGRSPPRILIDRNFKTRHDARAALSDQFMRT